MTLLLLPACYLFLFLSYFWSYGHAEQKQSEVLIDLETHFELSLLHTHQIHIPDHPHGFNPSLVPWKEGWLLSFREIESHEKCLSSHIYFVLLNQDFEPISPAQKLDAYCKSPADARLVCCEDKLYCVYSNKERIKEESHSIWRMWIAEVKEKNNTFLLHKPTKLTNFPCMYPGRDEKNWVPFFYDNQLLLAYSLQPHRIFRAQLETSTCMGFSSHLTKTMWKFGQMRGGTPAILVKGRYLAFFHSSQWLYSKHSQGLKSSHYFMGAYTFSATPPFVIQSISSRPIVGEGFYSGKQYTPYWKKSVQAIFPTGLIEYGSYLLVSYGRQDHEMWIATFDTELLLHSLRLVSTLPSCTINKGHAHDIDIKKSFKNIPT